MGDKASEVAAAVRAEGGWSGDLVAKRKDGVVFDVHVSSSLVLDATGQPICMQASFEDITERKRAQEALSRSLEATLSVISHAAETRDPYTAGHQRRVTELAIALAHKLGFPDDACDTLRIAGLLHDVGKLRIPAEILSKPSQLSALEFALIREHPETGYNILASVPFPGPVAEIILQHHERLDGSGYPRALKGDQILREARILAVADVIEAMASHRPYRPALGTDDALTEIRAGRGTRYDPQVVDACVALFESGEFSFQPASAG
jgi:putative nucleotidyltransferase with HDIG domain